MKYDTAIIAHGEDKFILALRTIIRFAVRVLAVLMTGVILMGVVDVAWTLHQKAMAPPKFILTISVILGVFGAFMAVLIAIEIFVNITIYLQEHVGCGWRRSGDEHRLLARRDHGPSQVSGNRRYVAGFRGRVRGAGGRQQ